MSAKQMTELLGVVNKEELLEVEKKIEKTLKQVSQKIEDAPHHVLQTRGSQRICVEEILVSDVESLIRKKLLEKNKESEEKSLDVVEVEKILSIVKAKYHDVEASQKEEPEVVPVFYRARANSTGVKSINP